MLPLINLLFDVNIFTYKYQWSFLKRNVYQPTVKKKKDSYTCLQHPIFTHSYWVHADKLNELIRDKKVKSFCIISSINIDNAKYNPYIVDYFLSKFRYPRNFIERQILVFDDCTYLPIRTERSLIEQEFWDKKVSYFKLYRRFEEFFSEKYNYDFTLKDTKNLYLQIVTLFLNIVTNKNIETKTELFNLCLKYPFHPLWQIFSRYFEYMKNLIFAIPNKEDVILRFGYILKNNFGLKISFWVKFLEDIIDRIHLDMEDCLNIIKCKKLLREKKYDDILENFLKKIDVIKIKNYIREVCL